MRSYLSFTSASVQIYREALFGILETRANAFDTETSSRSFEIGANSNMFEVTTEDSSTTATTKTNPFVVRN